MKTCTKCGECKALDQFRLRKTGKPFSHCKACDNARSAAWQKRNKDKNKAAVAKYQTNNREHVRALERARYEKLKAEGRPKIQWTDELRKRAAEYSANWRKRNPGKCRAFENNRKAAKLQRTPPWADMQAIEQIYEEAAGIRALGVDCHVDHYYPLRGRTVSGLHVAANLRTILGPDNQRKSNRHPDT